MGTKVPLAKRALGVPRVAAVGLLALAIAGATVGAMTLAPAAATSGAASIPLGDFAGGDPSGVTAFGAVTGTHPTLGTSYLDGSGGFAAMAGASGMSVWRNSGYRLVLGVPILPGTGTLASGAAGDYDQYFVTLAQNLVADGVSNAILRLGWEFNGNWETWSVANATDAANFAAYWRNIVTAMRSVAGENFQFIWNPNGSGSTAYTPDEAYPGDAYVDYVGTDIYDNCWCTPQTPQNAWAAQLSQPWGLNWLASFAAEHNKAIGFPEWSDDFRSDGHGLGDDPYFITQFAAWISTNNVAFTCIFSYDDTAGGQNNDITDGQFPNALAAFKADFGSSGPPPTTTTTASTTTTTAASTTTTTRAPTTTTTTASTTTTTAPTTTTTGAATTTTTTGSSPQPRVPSAPGGLAATVSGSTVTLSWTNASNTLGNDVYRDGTEIAWPGWPQLVASTYQDVNVPNGQHTYTVSGYDSAGVGPKSLSVTVTTPGQTPRTPAGNHPPQPNTDRGYWLVGSDGGVFAFGAAQYYGSTGAMTLARPIVSQMATPDTTGYWLVGSDGGVFAFGDAGYYGSTGGMSLARPVVGAASTPDGQRLLAGGLGRRRVRLRQRRVLRLDGRAAPVQAHRVDRPHARRQGLLAGGLGRRRVRLRRRRVLRLDGWRRVVEAQSSGWPPPPTAAATGWWARMAACSPSATPGTTARPGRQCWRSPSCRSLPPPTGAATCSSDRTEGCSASATPGTSAPRAPWRCTGRSWPWTRCSRRPGSVTGDS